ncbi:MAG: hypothetical protein ACI3XJ_05470 [Oscillospiraceae bacterium]
MSPQFPRSPFTTHLSGSAKETELRLRNIFQWKKQRPPVVLIILTALTVLLCCGLVSCQVREEPNVPEDTAAQSPAPERTDKALPDGYDFDHDGEADTVSLVTVWSSEAESSAAWYELQVRAADGAVLWTGEAAPPHVGWNSLFACTLDGRDYLLEYHPAMYQGRCTYSYRVFSLGPEGEELVLRENSVDFDTSFGSPLFESFDAAAVADFMDEINGLLAHSKLLLSTDEELAGIDPDHPQHTPTWLTCDDPSLGYTYDEAKTLRENLLSLGQTAQASSSQASSSVQTAPKVGVYIDAELLLYDPLGGLTEEQKALLSALPADELPREPVELRDLYAEDVWRGTLIPMAADEAADVTLYGVVNAEKSEEPESHAVVIRAVDGVVLRVGDRTAYYPLLWDNVVWGGSNPWMAVRDYDGDGKDEAAVCLHAGHGTGYNVYCLYLFDLDTMAYTTPDYSTLDIDVSYDPGSHTAVLSAGEHAVTVEVDPRREPPEEVSCGCIVSFSCEDGQLFCHVSLDFSGLSVDYLADASAPIVWDGNGYCLGPVTALSAS